MLTVKHTIIVRVCVAELASYDAATVTQVIYSASSVTERIAGSFLVAEKIYSVAQIPTSDSLRNRPALATLFV
jgi:hypothetical protein